MVWKRLMAALLICTLAVVPALPATASAAEFDFFDSRVSVLGLYPYEIPDHVLDVARDLAGKVSMFDSYVFFAAGPDLFGFLYGDLTFEADQSSVFRLNSGSAVAISEIETYMQLNTVDLSGFTFSCDGCLVYSNLGPYPDLRPVESIYLSAVLLSLCVLTFMLILHGIFCFTMRVRRSI